jgi:hypothetical protein
MRHIVILFLRPVKRVLERCLSIAVGEPVRLQLTRVRAAAIDFLSTATVPPLDVARTQQRCDKLLFGNSWYRIVQKPAGEIVILNAAGDITLVSDLFLATQVRLGCQHVAETARIIVSDVRSIGTGDDSEIALDATSKNLSTQITIVCRRASPAASVTFRTQSNLRSELEVLHHSLVLSMTSVLAALYLKNGKELRLFQQSRYWLDRQGARFGNGLSSVLVYHTPNISSLEVDIETNRLFVHVDHAQDHPLLHENKTGGYRDVSSMVLVLPQVHESSFTVWFGYEPKVMVRLMAQPGGFPSAHVWTEHACNTDFRVHRAVYFGSDQIVHARDAIGGFVKSKIPVTKSVFFENPNKILNAGLSKVATGPMPSLMGTEGFEDFIDELAKVGHEICLHCVAPGTSSETGIAAALKYMGERYKMQSWIDHFWFKNDGTRQGCQESFCCRGLRSYSRKLWEENNVRYFWNPYFEYMCNHPNYPYKNRRSPREELNHWTFDQDLHNPLYWRHPTFVGQADIVGPRTGPFMSFATFQAWYPSQHSNRYDPDRLSTLIDDWGISVAHSYITLHSDANKAWEQKSDGSIVISQEFDGLLKRMADLQRRGLLLNTTVRELLGYHMALEELEFRPAPEIGGIELINKSAESLRGLALASDGAEVWVNGRPVAGTWHSGSFIFVIDLEAGAAARIQSSKICASGVAAL